ncbi:MAG: class I SAM-dependent methyltransferase [Acidobacteria bacterium]|nr:class I SAM-dependent methyltransferase [Acidobacteriota bacterium]
MKDFYKADLAFIHDVGFAGFARNAAPGIFAILKHYKLTDGLVVDLGCGSGWWAKALTDAGYEVLGIDISAAMIRLARQRAPQAEFRVASLLQTDIPSCRAITSISECLNYLCDSRNHNRALVQLFRRIHQALLPGGVFIFDILEPGQFKAGSVTRGFTEGDGWAVLVEKREDEKTATLTRRIITFRNTGKLYRRDEEVHQVRLYQAKELAYELRGIGFQVKIMHRYGDYALPKPHSVLVARKPK